MHGLGIIRIHQKIFSFLPKKRTYFEFQKNLKGRRAIERNIEIIGEAVNRILKVNPNFPLEHARKIVDTRNRMIHGYDTVFRRNPMDYNSQGFRKPTSRSQRLTWGIVPVLKSPKKVVQ
jgi:hypothetical protein